MRIHRTLLLTLAFTGCSQDTQLLKEQTETMIGSAGGSALSADGRMKLDIPAGALSGDTAITILTRREFSKPRQVGHVYDFGPDGQTFAVPIQARLASDDPILLANFDDQLPQIVAGSTYDGSAAIAPLSHFSNYGGVSLFDACLNLPCGSSCTLCDPYDPTCSGTAGTCNGGGMCVATASVTCVGTPDAGTDPDGGPGGAHFTVLPTAIDFGAVEIGATKTLSAIVANEGSAGGTVHAIRIEPASFGVANVPSLPMSMQPGETFEVAPTFAALISGTATAAMVIDTSEGSLVVPLIGTGYVVTASCAETFQQPAEGSLDVLIVVDNSGSMADEQVQMGQTGQTLIDALVANNLSYHIGVTTTDTDVGGERGELLQSSGGIRIIDDTTTDPALVLEELVNAGISGSGLEMGFEAISLALSSSTTVNAGFHRSDAWLTAIVLSDEDDSGSLPPADFASSLFQLKSPGGERMVRMNGIVGGSAGCGGTAAPSPRYLDAVGATAGVSESICSPNWNAALSQLGGQGLGLPFRYRLRGLPNASTIQVAGSAGTIAADYDAGSNSLILTGDIPPASSVVVVTYEGSCP